MANLIHRTGIPIGRSRSVSSPLGSIVQPTRPTPAVDSLFFRLPLGVRQKIYGYVVGQHEVLHVLMKRKASHRPYGVVYRRCRAGGDTTYCIMATCKGFLDVANGVYFGSFDRVGGLLLTSRDM